MTQHGFTVVQLVHLTGRTRADIVFVLNTEQAAGRVVEVDDGVYALVAEAFPAGTVRALAGLASTGATYARRSAHARPNASRTSKSSSRASHRLRAADTRPREATL